MIYELRVYRANTGRMPDLLRRFEDHVLRIWERLEIRQGGFWLSADDAASEELTYMLVWDSLEEREDKWTRALADPEWLQVRSDSGVNGPLVDSVRGQFLKPTRFSVLQ